MEPVSDSSAFSRQASKTRPPKRGSFATDRQIFFAVRDSRLVRTILPGGEAVEGYVLGMDDYHWVVVDRQQAVHLVHKTVACFSVLTTVLSDEEPSVQSAIEPMVASFRDVVLAQHFRSATA